MQLLNNKLALVTGATAGIGKEIALQFCHQGASVIVVGTNAERAALVVEELESSRREEHQKFAFKLCDVGHYGAVQALSEEVLTEFGVIDILVNNAGVIKDNLLMKLSEEDWDFVLNTNLKSVFNFCHAWVRNMLKAKRGKIINVSSVVGLMGNPGQTNYAASKAGMIGMTKALAQEVASRNICVNCIAPGFIQTHMTEGLNEQQTEELLKSIPLKRLGHVRNIADAAVFLASSMADYITGQVLVVDGGMVMAS